MYFNSSLKITWNTSKLCIERLQDEVFLSIIKEDIVEKVQISHFSGTMNTEKRVSLMYG